MNERGPIFRLRWDPITGGNVLALLPVLVYAYYDPEGTCLYVGQTTGPTARHQHHRSKSPWIAQAGDMQAVGLYLKRGDALAAEAKAIRELTPMFNVRHNTGRTAA